MVMYCTVLYYHRLLCPWKYVTTVLMERLVTGIINPTSFLQSSTLLQTVTLLTAMLLGMN